MLSAQPEDAMRGRLSDNIVRTALSRQFGRKFPPQTFQQRWFVNVGQPRWDNDERRFKYKISLSRQPISWAGDDDESSHLSIDLTSTRRSLQDFVWLEQALRAEYNGALIVPILSLVLYFETLSDDLAAEDDELSTAMTSKGSALNSVVGENGAFAVVQSFKLLEEKMERNEIVNENTLSNWLSETLLSLSLSLYIRRFTKGAFLLVRVCFQFEKGEKFVRPVSFFQSPLNTKF